MNVTAESSAMRTGFIARAVACVIVVTHGSACLADVELKSTRISFSIDSTARALDAASPGVVLRALAEFARHPTDEQRRQLEAAGLVVLKPLAGTAYRVRLDGARVDRAALAESPLKPMIAQLAASDRVDPDLAPGRSTKFVVRRRGVTPRNFVVNANGTLNVVVRVYPDIKSDVAQSVLERHAARDQSGRPVVDKQTEDSWSMTLGRDALVALAQMDFVEWIDAGPPPFLHENLVERQTLDVNIVQNFDAMSGAVQGLGGKGVQVGIFDLGIDWTHDDLAGRVIHGTSRGVDSHATHVAGTVAGSGAMSAKATDCGTQCVAPFALRGMAPLAQVIDIRRGRPNGPNGASAQVHLNNIKQHGMDVSNHSYTINLDGSYNNSNETRDQIIRGDARWHNERVPARLHVTSAGNEQDYFTLTKQLKNAVVVGNWRAQVNQIHATSSLGPTQDGRIKPDVVAHGSVVWSTLCCRGNDCEVEDTRARACKSFKPNAHARRYYGWKTGTSQAAAAVSGVLALVLEQYARTRDLDTAPPLPSTLRAVVIHSARDLVASAENPDQVAQPAPGPDFVTGWGLVDAQAAVALVQAQAVTESSIGQTCDVKTYAFTVDGSVPRVRVTLAWDDVAADAALAASVPKLVNDLDLVLVDPQGQRHYAWKIDQKIVGATGAEITDADQTCGSHVTVVRTFTSGTVGSAVPPLATIGRDHLNNVEVVDAPGIPGVWTVQVHGFNVAQGPQPFSIVGHAFAP